MKVIVTGGAGFIGSHLIRCLLSNSQNSVLNIDKLTYASQPDVLSEFELQSHYHFEQLDLVDGNSINNLVADFNPNVIFHLAAESHVDRSIESPVKFIYSNIVGSFNLLEAARNYWQGLNETKKQNFRFIHISTDEVYGDLSDDSVGFAEDMQINPSSPYSASKAASDHLVQAWFRTYGLPCIITHCSNNYGAWQHEEKLIPLMTKNAINREQLPVYGDGLQKRDWLHVLDHINALLELAEKGKVGESYNIGTGMEQTNLDIIHLICTYLNELDQKYGKENFDYKTLISHVNDRPGHDRRYVTLSDKLQNETRWKPNRSFESGLKETVAWYFNKWHNLN